MGKKVIVSVIMCVYNEEEYMIEEAIHSVENQTYKDWELIIVLDNPANRELDAYLRKVQNSKIRVYTNLNNVGAAISRNIGVQHALGKYIAILDGDDVCASERLEREIQYLETGNYDMVCAGKHLIDEQSNRIDIADKDISERDLVECMPYINYVTNSSVLIRKSVYISLGGYYDYPYAHDYEFWLRLVKAHYKIGYLKDDLVGYRVRNNSLTGCKSHLQTIECAYVRKLYRKREDNKVFDYQEVEKFIRRYHVDDLKVIENYNRSVQKRKDFTKDLEAKKYCVAVMDYMLAVAGSRIYRLNIYNSIAFKIRKVSGLLEKC